MEQRIVFHIDFDYFYAQCEEIRKPELKTKPVAVCIFSDRGVIVAQLLLRITQQESLT